MRACRRPWKAAGQRSPAAFRYSETLVGATALGTLGLGTLHARCARTVAAARRTTTAVGTAALARESDPQRRQADAQARGHALLESLECGIQVSHVLHLPSAVTNELRESCCDRCTRQPPCRPSD